MAVFPTRTALRFVSLPVFLGARLAGDSLAPSAQGWLNLVGRLARYYARTVDFMHHPYLNATRQRVVRTTPLLITIVFRTVSYNAFARESCANPLVDLGTGQFTAEQNWSVFGIAHSSAADAPNMSTTMRAARIAMHVSLAVRVLDFSKVVSEVVFSCAPVSHRRPRHQV